MAQKVPLMILPSKISKILIKPFTGLSERISKFMPEIKYDLEESDIELSVTEYIAHSLANGSLFFILFFGLLLFLYRTQGKVIYSALSQSFAYALFIFAIILYILLKYPKIMAGKKAEVIDKYLVFALKDLRLQVCAGVPFYNALVNVSKAGYGRASIEIEKAAKAINTGTPTSKALEKMALESKSDFLRRTTWQIINTLKAGSSLRGALNTIIRNLTLDQRDRIKRYAYELNLWVLMYMLFAVAVPTIGATLLVILSGFAGFGVTKQFFIVFIVICFLIQVILIGFIKTRRPVVIV